METSAAELPRGTVTFLFTDIEGSTELARRLGAEFGPLRGEHHRVLREAIERHGGHEIDTAGDGFFVAFERAGDAVAAAVSAQSALSDTEVRVRMGLHSAEPYVHEDAYVGVGVHRAARICAAGHGGQILLSNATAGIVEDLGLEGVALLDLGEHRLKDLERPQRLFQVAAVGLASEFPPLKSLDGAEARPAVVSLLCSDLVGWGQVMKRFGDDRSAQLARAYAGIVTSAAETDRGRVVEVVADSVLALFDWPHDALRAATSIRGRLRDEPWFPGDDRPSVRIGIHSGRVPDRRSGYFGSVALHCTTLCGMAESGQILVSHATEALLEGEPHDAILRPLGERTVPSFDQPVRVFELR